jgi:hypothetical protein
VLQGCADGRPRICKMIKQLWEYVVDKDGYDVEVYMESTS